MFHDSLSFTIASEDDLPVFEKLAREAMATFYEIYHMEWESEIFRAGFLATENYRIERSGLIVGILRLAHEIDHIYVFDLHVEANARNQGIGTKALNFIRSIAARTEKNSIRMRTFKSNPAINLYERSGFVIVGEDDRLVRLEHVLKGQRATIA